FEFPFEELFVLKSRIVRPDHYTKTFPHSGFSLSRRTKMPILSTVFSLLQLRTDVKDTCSGAARPGRGRCQGQAGGAPPDLRRQHRTPRRAARPAPRNPRPAGRPRPPQDDERMCLTDVPDILGW